MKLRVVLFFGTFLLLSCGNDEILPGNEFTVIVENTSDLACALPVIRFLDKEIEVKKKTKLETLTYNAYHLNNSLNVNGRKLIIEFTLVANEDMRACNTLGIGFPGISITNARFLD
jgi:hypothetical protein